MIHCEKKTAFSLIELMIGIAIIIIVLIGASNLNVLKVNNNLKLEKAINGIQNHYESIRNNALIGRSIGINIDMPDAWRIEFTTNSSGSIMSSYSGTTWASWQTYKTEDLTNKFVIDKIECFMNNATTPTDTVANGTIILNQNEIKLGGGCSPNTTRLKIYTSYFGNKQNIEINTLNGLFKATKVPF